MIEDNNLLTNIILTYKIVILLLQFGFLRISTIAIFSVDNMTLNDIWVTFLRKKVLIHSRQSMRLEKFEYRA